MLQSLATFDVVNFIDTSISLAAAFVLGGAIGLERQIRQRTAGLRTNVLVCVGAALFVDIAVTFTRLHGGSPGPLQVVAYVVSGVGFLGAGVIMRDGGDVRGINTAATLWGSAAVGAAAGADLLAEAVLGTLFVLAANTLLRPVVRRIERRPIDDAQVEAVYTVVVTTPREQRHDALEAVQQLLEQASLPLRDVEVAESGEDEATLTITLLPSSMDGGELDALIERLHRTPGVSEAFWNAEAGG